MIVTEDLFIFKDLAVFLGNDITPPLFFLNGYSKLWHGRVTSQKGLALKLKQHFAGELNAIFYVAFHEDTNFQFSLYY